MDGECPRGLLTNEQCASLSDYDSGPGTCIALHAEQNALAYASYKDTKGGTLYITGKQCGMCRKLTMAAGIKKVVWPEGIEEFK